MNIYELNREHAAKVAIDGVQTISNIVGLTEDALECLAEASSLRHILHSENRWRFVAGEFQTELERVGTQYSLDGGIADEIDALDLVDASFPILHVPEVDDSYSTEDICNALNNGEMVESRDDALELLFEAWDKALNSWSFNVRKFFHSVNVKYGTRFPDAKS